MRNFLILSAALLLTGISTGYSQVNTTAGAHVPNHGRVNSVNEREDKILSEILEGVQSDALTPAQADEFKRRYNAIQAQKTNAMMERHGHLSKSEAKDLRKQEDRLEHDIKADHAKQ